VELTPPPPPPQADVSRQARTGIAQLLLRGISRGTPGQGCRTLSCGSRRP
jgi:hypothetical protein